MKDRSTSPRSNPETDRKSGQVPGVPAGSPRNRLARVPSLTVLLASALIAAHTGCRRPTRPDAPAREAGGGATNSEATFDPHRGTPAATDNTGPPAPSEPISESDASKMKRQQMVTLQLAAPGRDIEDSDVLGAMGSVPRHEFVPEELRRAAYEDRPLPIGHGQTISQPYIVAFMTEQLRIRPGDRILEVGTGSGYQAAILAELGAEVYSIEIVQPLAERASETLSRLGYDNVHVRHGNGYLGWPEEAPFDAVIVTCAPESVPQPLVDQLKEGGRLIIPVGRYRQELHLLTREGDTVRQQAILPVRFVPMTGRPGDQPGSPQSDGM